MIESPQSTRSMSMAAPARLQGRSPPVPEGKPQKPSFAKVAFNSVVPTFCGQRYQGGSCGCAERLFIRLNLFGGQQFLSVPGRNAAHGASDRDVLQDLVLSIAIETEKGPSI